jgi:hypothetical protein
MVRSKHGTSISCAFTAANMLVSIPFRAGRTHLTSGLVASTSVLLISLEDSILVCKRSVPLLLALSGTSTQNDPKQILVNCVWFVSVIPSYKENYVLAFLHNEISSLFDFFFGNHIL